MPQSHNQLTARTTQFLFHYRKALLLFHEDFYSSKSLHCVCSHFRPRKGQIHWKNNMNREGSVGFNVVQTLVCKLSTFFVATFFKPLYTMMSVRGQMKSVSNNLLIEIYWNAQTTFCCQKRCSRTSIEKVRYPSFIFKCHWKSLRSAWNSNSTKVLKDLKSS